MSNEKSKFLLYQLNPLRRLEEIKLKDQGKKEKYIEDFFVNNLENIFSDLVLLKRQYYLKSPNQEKDCIIDTLAFNKKDNSFLIIEYKREKAVELFYQVREYIECLEEEGDIRIVLRNRNKLLRLLDDNDLTKKKRNWEEEDIDWGKTKGLCIVNEIYGRFPQKEMNSEEVKVIKVAVYGENTLYIDIEKITEWLKVKNSLGISDVISYNSSDSSPNKISGRQISPKTSWKLSELVQEFEDYFSSEVRNILLDFDKWIPGKLGYKIPPRPHYINYFWEEFPKPPFLFSLVPWKKQINVYWNFLRDKERPENLLEKYGLELEKKGHLGIGDWKFPVIKSINDLQKLKEFIREYKTLIAVVI